MEIVILNSVLYLFTLYKHYKETQKLDFAFVVLAVYAFVAVMGVFYYSMEPSIQGNITLFPLIYLFGIFLIFSYPFRNKGIKIDRFEIENRGLFNIFLIIFLVSSIVSVVSTFSSSYQVFLTNDWDAVYQEEDKIMYNNQFERLAKNITGYGGSLACIISFYYLSLSDIAKKWKYLAIASIVLIIFSGFLNASMMAARGMALKVIFLVLTVFMLFKDRLDSKLTKKVFIYGTLLFIVYFAYSSIIATARFDVVGSNYNANQSMIAYLGMPMLKFDYGIMDSIHSYMHGDFILGTNGNKYYSGLDSILGTHVGTAFCTFIGNLYMDFGPIGTLLIAIVVSAIFSRKIYIKDLADAYIMCFYFQFIMDGVFVYGRGYYFKWLVAIIIYIILKRIK